VLGSEASGGFFLPEIHAGVFEFACWQSNSRTLGPFAVDKYWASAPSAKQLHITPAILKIELHSSAQTEQID